MRDQPLPRAGAAGEEGERGADGRGRVVERAAQRQLLVVEAVAVDGQLGAARQPAEEDDGAAGADELERVAPRLLGAGRLDHDVGLLGGRAGAELARELAALLAAADDERPPAGVGDAGAEHQPDRPGAEDRDRVALLDPGAVDAVQAQASGSIERGDLGREPRRDGQEVAAGDPLGDEDQLGVGAVQEREQVLAERLVAAGARGADAAGRRVRRDHPPAERDVDPAELVPERARRRAEQQRVAAVERLGVGAVGERDLDLDEHVAGAGLRIGNVLEPEVARPVEDQRLHGVKTTFSASPLR